MKQKPIVLRAVLLAAAALMLVCGPAFAETLNVAKIDTQYGFKVNAPGDAVTFKKGDTLKAVVTDTTKLAAQLKTSPSLVKGTPLTLIYKGNREFSIQRKCDGKMAQMGRMIMSAASVATGR